MERNLLLVDPDHDFLDWAAKHLEAPGIRVLKCDDSEKAFLVTKKAEIDIVVAANTLEPLNGLDFLKKLRAANDNALYILTANFPTASEIIKATQHGAHDIVKKETLTFELRPLIEAAWQILDNRKLAHEATPEVTPEKHLKNKIIGKSRVFQELFKTVGKVARTDAPILISGESGTGKEVVANSIHENSPRSKNELVAINCGAIPDNLLESELFGHEKGSFTGASARREGRFEQCDQSTLFLDEIGDMPLNVQVKLLRVLQEGTFSRVGGNDTISSDVRIIAATNKDLAVEVVEGRFREDLYYRLNVVEIHLPPLRDRKEDIPLLADFFLQKITQKNDLAPISLSEEAKYKLQQHAWKGNVRELENSMARACALADSDVLLADDIPLHEGLSLKSNIQQAAVLLDMSVEELEKLLESHQALV